jgi:AAA+ superfamily predicted ATPase
MSADNASVNSATDRNSGIHPTHDPLSLELARLDRMFALHLVWLRKNGRSNLGDAVGGAVIEDGEAEGLLESLHKTHTRRSDQPGPQSVQISPLAGLEHARKLYNLSVAERDLLLLALSVEIDSRYARLIAYLNDHVALTRPTLGLGIALLAADDDHARIALLQRLASGRPIDRFGLLELDGDGPVANRALKIPETFWPRLLGIQSESRFPAIHLTRVRDDVVMDRTFAKRIDSITAWAMQQLPQDVLLIVAGESGTGRDTIAQLVAGALSPSHIVIDARNDDVSDNYREIARECRWHDATLIIRNAETLPVELHRKLQSVITSAIICITEYPHDGALLRDALRNCMEISVPVYNTAARARIWSQLLQRHSLQSDPYLLANRFGFGPGRIDKALQLASTVSDADGNNDAYSVIEGICHKMQRAQFDHLTDKLPCPFAESDIILPDKTRRELDLVCTWARHGHKLFTEDGIGSNLHTGKGLICLFSGPPGTGKTMAAQVIARRIGFDIFRIDLSQVVNKYVGETEKRLAKVFAEAERSRVILFFDEAESLYGSRSEAKTAQDRFANIEIGYLLQRIETFEGIAILATNLQKSLDEAFSRRLNVTAEFPVPGSMERSQIWNKLLPPAGQRSDDIDIDLLSRQFKITGGDIRNAIFSALLLSADERITLGMAHLVRGLWRELQKSGRVVDTAQFGAWRKLISNRITIS